MLTGHQIGKYRINGKLGSGGMADVYLAEDTALKRQVALKVLPPEFARDADRAGRFEKEVLHSASLQHPGIVTIHDVGHEQGIHFYTMALLPGGDFKQRIQRGLSTRQALELLKQIAEALGYAHQRGFVHRDLKPENILFDAHGKPVITDFGIAKAVGTGTRMTGTGMSIGTPHYMSPEQAQGDSDLDGRSDLYSLGIMLYEMLTGYVPFDADNTVGIAMKHVTAPLPQLPREVGKLQPLLDRLLAKDPAQRYQSAGELVQALDSAMAGKLPEAAPKAPVQKTQVMKAEKTKVSPGPSGKGSGLKWAIGGALLALVIAGGLFAMNGSNKAPVLSGGGGTTTPAPIQAVVPQPKTLVKGDAILQVTSEPTGATVLLDGVELGQTPLIRSDLPAGQHELKLTLAYYQETRQNVQLGSSEVVKELAALKRGEGKVTVLTNPSGATILLDGKSLKEKTPLTVTTSAGPHTLNVHLDKYYDQEQSVEVQHQQTAMLELKLVGGNLVKYAGEWLEPDEAAARKAEAVRVQAEKDRQAAAERERQRIAEEKRKVEAARIQAEKDRQAAAERERQRVAEEQRQAEINKQREEMAEKERLGQEKRQKNGPEVIVLKATMGDITFRHRDHQRRTECASCHAAMRLWSGKDFAHRICKDCHKKSNGPTKCKKCHVR